MCIYLIKLSLSMQLIQQMIQISCQSLSLSAWKVDHVICTCNANFIFPTEKAASPGTVIPPTLESRPNPCD